MRALAAWALFGGLVVLAVVATFYMAARMSGRYESRRKQRESAAPRRACSTCRSDMDFSGIRVVSTDEGDMPLEIYTCPRCRKVEMFLPPAAIE